MMVVVNPVNQLVVIHHIFDAWMRKQSASFQWCKVSAVLGNEIVHLYVENECALIAFWWKNKGVGKKNANITYAK